MLACRVGRGGIAAAAAARWFHRGCRTVALLVVVFGPEPTAALVLPAGAVVVAAAAASVAVAGSSDGFGSSHLHLRHHHRSQFQGWCCGW